jgi:hypothetical protein
MLTANSLVNFLGYPVAIYYLFNTSTKNETKPQELRNIDTGYL